MNHSTNAILIARLANIATECAKNPTMSEYSQSEYEWIPCLKYKTDCTGLLCEILYECRQKKAQKLYKSILEFSRKHNHKLYPSDLPRICLARCLFQYIETNNSKSTGIKQVTMTNYNPQQKFEKGDLIVWKYSENVQIKRKTSTCVCTGHLIFLELCR